MIKHGDVVRLKKYLGGNDLLREGDLLEVATLTDDTLVCVAIDGYAKDSMVALSLDDIEVVSKEELTIAALTDDPVSELWNKLRVVAREEDIEEVKNIVRAIDLYK